jgi:hypothetical protein
MDNETTMPGLLTRPAVLGSQRNNDHAHPPYGLIVVGTLLILVITIYLL